MTFTELAQKALRGGTEADADYALWNHTPFPFDKTPRVLFKKIDGYRRACANKRQLCTFCSNIADDGDWDCARCKRLISSGQGTEQQGSGG